MGDIFSFYGMKSGEFYTIITEAGFFSGLVTPHEEVILIEETYFRAFTSLNNPVNLGQVTLIATQSIGVAGYFEPYA